ncbi:protein adenylyltransferase SelO family protein [Brevundimonas sp.]|uniref:protein adenylyltransferase SelO family protein n=1 Tax=Brevundimonas sp. TaxID=1871086 RepID=UPI0025EACB3C|nr:YdiU family protein [Brevundimonas sp.]
MPVSAAYLPDPKFAELGPEFQDPVQAALFPQALLRWRDQRAARTVGLDALTETEWLAHFARFDPLPGQPAPLAMRYHGHQFRTYNPDIGDGRGFLAAQLRDDRGRLLDLGTKGSGRTPWSRDGDGRLTLKGGVREVLASEMLQALGVPTCRILSLVETGEELERHDEPSPTRGSVMVRLQHGHVRIGTFQRLAFFERSDLLAQLVEHVRATYHPDAEGPAGVLRAVVGASARLVARWTAVGFVHGVLNTDNLNVTGESFDYGPWRFLPQLDANFTAAYFDRIGLYSFGRQAEAVFWNLRQLAGTLRPLAEESQLVEALNAFGPAYVRESHAALRARLGLLDAGETAAQRLIETTFELMAEGGEALGFEPLFFDWYCGTASRERALSGPREDIYRGAAFAAFEEALSAHTPDRPERLAHPVFSRPDPETMLIDEVEAIWSPIAERDDWSAFARKIERIREAGAAYGLV